MSYYATTVTEPAAEPIPETDYAKETDIFDWINSFEFNKIIKSIDNKFNIFDNL